MPKPPRPGGPRGPRGPRRDGPRPGGPRRDGPRRDDRRDDRPRVVEVVPERLVARGEAEVRAGDRSLLVWQGIPGEPATVRLEHVGQHQSAGRWVGSPRPDAHRVEPVCEKYTACGGCPLMHLSPAGQELHRRALVAGAFADAGLADVPIGAWHPSPDGALGFRHVIKVAIGRSDRGHIRLGAWGRGGRHVVPIPHCPVAAPVLRDTMAALAHHVIDLDLGPYDPASDRGVLRSAVLRASRATGEVLVTLIAGRNVRELRSLAERLAESATHTVGVWLHINSEPGNAIFARDEGGALGLSALIGKSTVEERLNGVAYRIGPGDFFQTNPAMAEVLYARTLDRLELGEGDPFVDLYCGVGGLAVPGALRTGWALGVEENDGAVQRAREAARINGASAEFVSGRVADVLPGVGRRMGTARPVVAINPARRGLEPGVAEALVALRPRRIAYVSCNPAAMARDVAALRAQGYTPGPVEVFDMFPNTGHVECLTVLDAADSEDAGGRAPRRRTVRGRVPSRSVE